MQTVHAEPEVKSYTLARKNRLFASLPGYQQTPQSTAGEPAGLCTSLGSTTFGNASVARWRTNVSRLENESDIQEGTVSTVRSSIWCQNKHWACMLAPKRGSINCQCRRDIQVDRCRQEGLPGCHLPHEEDRIQPVHRGRCEIQESTHRQSYRHQQAEEVT